MSFLGLCLSLRPSFGFSRSRNSDFELSLGLSLCFVLGLCLNSSRSKCYCLVLSVHTLDLTGTPSPSLACGCHCWRLRGPPGGLISMGFSLCQLSHSHDLASCVLLRRCVVCSSGLRLPGTHLRWYWAIASKSNQSNQLQNRWNITQPARVHHPAKITSGIPSLASTWEYPI